MQLTSEPHSNDNSIPPKRVATLILTAVDLADERLLAAITSIWVKGGTIEIGIDDEDEVLVYEIQNTPPED